MMEILVQLNYEAAEVNAVFNSMSEGMYGIDEFGTCLFINRAALKLLGYKHGQCIGKNIHHLIHYKRSNGRPFPEQDCPITKAFKGRNVKREQDVFFKSDGSPIYVRYTASPIIKHGLAVGVVVTFSDVTAEKLRADEFLRATINQTAMINATRDMIWSVDKNLRLVSANESFFQVINQLSGKDIKPGDSVIVDTFSEQQKQQWLSYYKQAFTGEPYNARDKMFNPLSGCPEHVLISFNPIFGISGKQEGVACYLKPITTEVINSETLEKTKNELQKVLDSSADMICTINVEGLFTSMNQACYAILGYKPAEIVGRPFSAFIFSDDQEKSLRAAAEVADGKAITNFSNRYVHKEGHIVPIIWSARYEAENAILYCVGRDATEHARNEEKLKLSEQRFKNLVQNGSDMIAILDVQGNYLYVSPTSLSVLDIAPEEFIGKNAFDFIHPDDVESVLNQFQRLENEPQLVIPEFRFKDRQGNWRWIETIVSNMTDDPAVNGIVANSRDITQRKQAEMTLRMSEEKYRMLFQYGPLPKWIYDRHTLEILDVNALAVEKYGYSREEFLSMTIKDLRPASEIPNLLKGYKEAMSRDQDVHRFGVYTHQKKNGELIKAEIWGHKVVFDDRECIMGLVDDVTERENTLQQLKESEEKLRVATSIAALGYWQIDYTRNKLSWSDEVYQIWGILPGSIEPGLDYFMRTMPFSDREPFLKAQAAALRGGSELDCEHRVIMPDGNIRWVHEKGRLIEAKDGEPLIFGGTVQDITEKKLLELSLQESNQRYGLVTKATSDVIWDWNIVHNRLYLSEGFTRSFGHALPEELKLLDKHQFVHPQDYEKVTHSLEDALSALADFWECEYQIRRADNTWAHVIDKGLIVKDQKGKPARVVGALRDISDKKAEEHRLKLMESVITQTNDSVLITDAIAADESGPPIIYANDAFIRMTGYNQQELQGKTPGILYGPQTDPEDLARLYKAIAEFKPCEVTVINYKKNGQPFWNQFSVNPVSDQTGAVTHWIAIGRDITKRKRQDIYKNLMSRISQVFNESADLIDACAEMLSELVKEGKLCMAELWLPDSNHETVKLSVKSFETHSVADMYTKCDLPTSFACGEGLPGLVWQHKKIINWEEGSDDKHFIRSKAAKLAGIKKISAVPLLQAGNFVGALLLGMPSQTAATFNFAEFSNEFCDHLAEEIKRKQLEQELDRIFNLTPDVICMMNRKGRFLRINPAASKALGHSERDLLQLRIFDTVSPEDKSRLDIEFASLDTSQRSSYAELCHVTSDDQRKWLAWSLSSFPEEGLIFAVAKDISEKKQLELLLERSNEMARIGSWEVDVLNDKTYWSPMLYKLMEYDIEGEAPNLAGAINLYKQGESREKMAAIVGESLISGSALDLEVQIITAKGNELWVKVIGQPKMKDGKCVALYGSFQDINVRKEAQLALTKALEEKNNILESIGDGFFAVNKDWTVSYWNTQAENMLFTPKQAIIGKNLWDVFSDSKESLSYQKYHEALLEGEVKHFEDWYESLKRWYGISAYPSSTGLSVFFKDITEARLAKKELEALNESLLQKTVALEKSEKRYSDLFHLSPQPMWVYELSSLKFLDVNNAAILHYGFSHEEFLKMTLRDIRPAEDIPELEKSVRQIPARENYISQGTYRHQKKNGEIINVEISGNTISYKGFPAEIVFAIDVTERQRYIEAIEEQNKNLLDIAWLQSHVVRAPVARILGLSNLLNDIETSPEATEIVNFMADSVSELDKAIVDVTEKIQRINIPSDFYNRNSQGS